MADDRTKRQKLEAVINGRGVTDGERENAKRLLAKMKPEPNRASGLRDIIDRDARRSAPAQRPAWDRPPDPVYDTNFRFNSGFWDRFGSRPRSSSQAEATYADLLEQLKRMMDEDLKQAFTPNQKRACDLGHHQWVVVGHALSGADINRCFVCGEYETKKKKTHRSDDIEDHDWEDDHNDGRRTDMRNPTLWTQTCRGCNLHRVDPNQPPLWADYEKEP